jgi:CelD/BcsL family acetyltransferase involved in cellulose biosynthesis
MPTPKPIWTHLPASALGTTAELQNHWNRLNAARANVPFLSANAVQAALTAFGVGNERLLVARQSDTVVAMLVMVPTGAFQWRTFQPSQLPLGAWVAAADLAPTQIARQISRGPLGFCLSVAITQIDPYLAPREEDQADTKNIDYIDTGWIDIAGSFDEYWEKRGKNLRQNMRKQRNKLAAEGVITSMRTITAADDMPGVIERYGILESSGWKASKGTAIHPDNAQGKFYIDLLQTAARSGNAVVYEYVFNEKTVALNLCLQSNGMLVILKTTYDESIQIYSPAFLLNQDLVEQIFTQAKIQRLEYYGKVMEWHTRWTENKRTLYHLTCYRWPWLNKLAEKRRKQPEMPPQT